MQKGNSGSIQVLEPPGEPRQGIPSETPALSPELPSPTQNSFSLFSVDPGLIRIIEQKKEQELNLLSNLFVKLIVGTDLCYLSVYYLFAVKFCIFCKLPPPPNRRCLKSLYIGFFFTPLFSTKCVFYLE